MLTCLSGFRGTLKTKPAQGPKGSKIIWPGRWWRCKVKLISHNKGSFLCIALDAYLNAVTTALCLDKYLAFWGSLLPWNARVQKRKLLKPAHLHFTSHLTIWDMTATSKQGPAQWHKLDIKTTSTYTVSSLPGIYWCITVMSFLNMLVLQWCLGTIK